MLSVPSCNYILHLLRASRPDCESWGGGGGGENDSSFLWPSTKREFLAEALFPACLGAAGAKEEDAKGREVPPLRISGGKSPVKRWQAEFEGIPLVFSRKSVQMTYYQQLTPSFK